MPVFSIDGIYSLNKPLSYPDQASSSQRNNELDDPATKKSTTNEDTQSRSKEPATRENQARDTQEIRKLVARDKEVRAHEAAHINAGGKLIRGAAQFSYQKGPDGKQYANGGEVSIDTSSIPGNPRANLQKANQIRVTALAPAKPSNQDISVAANAGTMAANALIEIAKHQVLQESEALESSPADNSDQNHDIKSSETPARSGTDQSDTDNKSTAAGQNPHSDKISAIPKYIAVSHAPSTLETSIDLFV